MTKRTLFFFGLAILMQATAFTMMAVDPVASGFGVLTLWIAPILLIIGLVLPVIPLIQQVSIRTFMDGLRLHVFQSIGFAVSFLIAFGTYLLTLEPTASLWDCSETLAASYKLQVPHTPGTPLTLLLGRLFSMLSLGDVTRVAWCVNMMSGFFSALAVAFTFLILWNFGSRLVQSKQVVFLGGLVGSLVLTFSDSFWFSAVEAETYGPSVFFMVLLIWVSLKPEVLKGQGRANRILLISYLLGLAYCIHPMCILILPVCVILWRSENTTSWKQLGLSFFIGGLVILLISKVIAVDLFEWAFQFDLFAVNTLSLPLYSGVVLLFLLVSTVLIIIWKRFPKARLWVMSLVLLVAGFSPYLMLFIRSTQMPPINEFVPGDLAKIKPYMNRESYPSRPLLYGPYFDAKIDEVFTKADSYVVDNGQYKKVGEVPEYHYEDQRKTILPRIYSNDPAHIKVYQEWAGLAVGQAPKFSHNLRFMFQYQIGHMYLRYLFWNFAGRLSDEQHAGWAKPWQGLADRDAISYNRAFNQYFWLPLLIGLLGIYMQSRRDRRGFVANISFFLITGLLLTLYLNGTPNEPRERDYIYVGSYLAYCIWIGLGAMWLASLIRNKSVQYVSLLLLFIPGWVAYQNWDDHDRSGRTFQMDYARAILNSCEQNAILFTGGDNDTFPLWYLQEVEGFRTDVRVKVMSYFNTDWYINDLSRSYYESPPLKLTLQLNEAEYGPYDPVYIQETMDKPIAWDKYMQALKNRNPNLMFTNRGSELFILPSRKLLIKTSAGNMDVQVSGSYLPKSEMAILDLIATNDWERPVYFNFTSVNSLGVDLKKYVVQEGLVYRLTPEEHSENDIPIDIDKSYHNLTELMDYSNLADSDIYFNFEDFHARMINPLRFSVNALINQYVSSGKKEKALELSEFALEKLYSGHLPPSYAEIQLSQLLSASGQEVKAKELLQRTFEYYHEYLNTRLELKQSVDRNDLLVFQEAARLLKEERYYGEYSALIDRISEVRLQ